VDDPSLVTPEVPTQVVSDVSDPDVARIRLDAERLRLFGRQVVRAPIAALVAPGFIAYIMAPHMGPGIAWGWAGAALGMWSLRALVCAVLLARPPTGARIRMWIRFLVVATAVSGMVAGSATILFFRAPPLEWALLTMVLCSWSAGGIAVSGAVPAAFYGLVIFFLGPLAVAWGVSDMPLRLPVAGMILFLLFYLVVFARDGAALMARALRVGFENEDLAKRLRAREAEAQAARDRAEEANLAKSRFLAAASHDLRQPLHSLSLLLDHVVQSTQDPKTSQVLRQVARSADSLDKLFSGLLDLSRLDAGSLAPEVRPLSLGALLKQLENDFRPLTDSKGLALDCAPSEAWVRSDPAMLERILRNLLDNAVKYTAQGSIAVHVDNRDQEVRVSVRDTGIGIDPADRSRIFEEYYQVRNPARDRSQGIGLGLAIVKRLCELLGHSIEVDSVSGQGSTITIALARCEPPASREADEAFPLAASLEALRGAVIVVIDDDTEVRDAMRTLLEDWACRPVVGEDSAAAIAQLEARGLVPDAILADWRLAGPENGLQAIEKLNARFGERPAAIVTGEINPTDLQVPEHLSVTVMQKPVRARDISEWLLLWKSLE
jgi:signal transduction histidine kinase